ncbi:MAG: ornithine cyclodeaminase family protein [Candidatus Thorarchaeota archaeon]
MILLKNEDITELVTMEECIAAVEQAFLKDAEGKTVYPSKSQFMLPTDEWRWWAFMPVYVEGMGVACKAVCDYPQNKKRGKPTIIGTILLADSETGEIQAIMDGTRLTALRTGALGAVAAKYLSRKDAVTVGIVGCGIQARKQLEGLTNVRPITRAKIFDLNSDAMDKFKDDMAYLGIEIETSDAEQVQNADIVVAATPSKEPVINGNLIGPGTHVTSIGAHTPDAREVDDNLIHKSKIVIDSADAKKSGDIKDYHGDPIKIKDVLTGTDVRTAEDDITFFKSVGTALQDVAAASLAYEKALEKRNGMTIEF